MSALLIALIVFLSLLGLTMIIFNVIYCFNRRNINCDYKLKNKFNYYKNNTIGSNLKSIETLVKKNQGLEPILEYLRNCHTLYTKQLEIVKVQLQKISEEIRTLRILSTWRKLKQIKQNFELLDKQQAEFKKVNINTQKYLNTCSKLATDLFEIVSSITSFQKDKFFVLYHDDIQQLKIINRDINDLSILINNDINYINSTKIHSLFLNELAKIEEFYTLTYNLFNIYKYTLALEALISYGSKIVEQGNFEESERINLLKKINTYKNKNQEVNDLLKRSQFEKAKALMSTTIIELENSLIDLKINQKYLSIYETHIKSFQANIDLFYQQLTEHHIKDVYADVVKNFQNDPQVVRLIYSNIDLTNNISQEINHYYSFVKTKQPVLQIAQVVQYIFQIYQYILQFQYDNEQLLKLIEQKHKHFVEVIFHLHDAKLKILDLERLMLDFNIQNQTITDQINEEKKTIETLKTKVQTTFLDLDNNLISELTSIDDFITTSFNVIKTDINLISIIKRLKMYATRYQQLATKEQLQALDKLYKKHQYYELIETYIEFLQKMKKLKKAS